MELSPSRSRGRDTFEAVSREGAEAFEFLTSEFGFRAHDVTYGDKGFQLQFERDELGVRVAYAVGDPLSVDVCLLDGGVFPGPTGELRPDSRVRKFDLLDIEAVQDISMPASSYAIPTRQVLDEYARRLREAAGTLLAGDQSLIPTLQGRVLDRARAAAQQKWGERAAEFGW